MCGNSYSDAVSTMDWVTFWIAVIGFCLSVFNFIETILKNSKRLSVSVKHLCKCDNHVVILMEFTNRSHLGISITSGKFISKTGESIVFGEVSRELFRYTNAELKGKPNERTVTFPIHIDPLKSERVLLLTEDGLPGFSSSYKIVLGSSRGKIAKNVVLPTAHEDFVSLLEHLN